VKGGVPIFAVIFGTYKIIDGCVC